MKAILLAGGAGTRFWPLSRNSYPKQFMPIINNKSPFERHFQNLSKILGINNIYVAVNDSLVGLVNRLFPQLPLTNIVSEPAIRDVGPAIGLVLMKIRKFGDEKEPVLIMWSDNYIGNYVNFRAGLKTAEAYIAEDPNKLIIIGEKPTFPNENLGWIELGKKVSQKGKFTIYQRKSWTYRPPIKLAKKWFADKTHIWNAGYFVSTTDFLLKNYNKFYPKMYQQLATIYEALDTDHEASVIKKIYPKIESVHFDHVVPEKLKAEETLVVEASYKWQDPGTLYALKQFFQKSHTANVTKGDVITADTSDSLIYNLEKDKVLATIGLDGFIIVNMDDALFICHKDNIPRIKEVLNEIKKKNLKQYL